MRIGLFSDYYHSRGDGTAVATHLSREGLARRGHKVTVFSPRLPSRPADKEEITVASVPGWLYPGLRISWPFNRRNLKKADVDIFHLQTPLFVGLFGLWAAKKLRRPSVASVHLDMDFMGSYAVRLPALAGLVLLTMFISPSWRVSRVLWPRRVDRSKRRTEDFAWRCMAFFADRTNLVIAPSQKNYDQLVKYVDSAKLRLVPNGVAEPALLTQVAARDKLHFGKKDFIVLSGARHVREKRVDFVVMAFARLLAKNPHARLVLLNHGPTTNELKKLVQQLNINDRVTFPGVVHREKVFGYLAACDVYANACLREVGPLGLLEAAVAGKPIIAFDRRLTEPLEHGYNGYFVSSINELGQRLLQLSRDKTLLKTMSAHSSQKSGRFSLETHTNELLKVYNELIGRG